MTAHPRNCASDAAETLDVSALVDDLERAARAMIQAGNAQIVQGEAQLESCRALRAQCHASDAADMASDLIPVTKVAQLIGVSKEAMRMKVRRKGVGIKVGGRLHVHVSAIGSLYS
jgi:hypothetical protein